MTTWKSIVKSIKEIDPVSADVVNFPLGQLTDRTGYLKAILDNIAAGEFNYIRNVPVSGATPRGSAVYWDTAERRFSGVLAAWDDDLSPYGSLLPAESSYLAGILAEKHTDGTGSVIISGYIRDFADLGTLFGSASPAEGIYYVSGDVKGRLTTVPPPMTVPAVVYDGSGGVLLLPTGSIVSNHDHHKYTLLDDQWLAAIPENFPGMDIPSGAYWGYDKESADPSLLPLFLLYTGAGAFVLKDSGTILNDEYILFDEQNVWILDEDSPSEDIVAYIANPNAHGPNIVRAITTDTPEYLGFKVENGLCTATLKEPTVDEEEDDSIEAVKSIAGNVVTKGKVVTQVIAGLGISLTSEDGDGHGKCIINAVQGYGDMKDADIVNLNNAIQRTDGGLVYSVFPSGRDSSMTVVNNLGEWDGSDRSLKIWLVLRGLTPAGNVTPAFDLKIFVFPRAWPAGVALPSEYVSSIPVGIVATDPGNYYLCEADLGNDLLVPSGAQIQYNIEPSVQPAQDYLVLRQGISTYVPLP